MAPPRGRRKKATAAVVNKSAIPSSDEAILEPNPAPETTNNFSSIDPKDLNKDDETVTSQLNKVSANMEIDESLLQSSEHDNAAMPTIEADNQLLYEGDDGFSADVNNELSYAPEDVDALLGDDDNEDVANAVEEYATEEDVVYDQGQDGSEYIETAEEEGVDTSESQDDSKEKSKLVKTTYHYVNDKSEEMAMPGNIWGSETFEFLFERLLDILYF